MILERAHRALDSIERGPTLTEHLPAFEDGGPDAFAELVPRLPGIGTGAAVDDDGRHARGGDSGALWRHGFHRVTIRPGCKELSTA